MIKLFGKKIVVAILYFQLKRLLKNKPIKIIGVVGSYGKTSTKLTIAKVLESKYKVIYQEGNYNDIVTIPLVFFKQETPSLYNPLSWLKLLINNEHMLKKPYEYEIAVLELGTDAPGQIASFKKYIHLEIAVITAIALEHMESFQDLSDVASEELTVADYSDLILYNKDLCSSEYINKIDAPKLSYSLNKSSDYYVKQLELINFKQLFEIYKNNEEYIKGEYNSPAKAGLYSVCVATIIADILTIEKKNIAEAIKQVKPLSGRMQMLRGINDSNIIDDSYNSSPNAVKAALDVLYSIKSPQKIAVLGSMNELGTYSELSHTEIGNYCDPKQIDLLITIGSEANNFIAVKAKSKGINVQSFLSPYEAGDYLKNNIKNKALILVKGSQNMVFSEEVIKSILKDRSDSAKLVRQTKYWLKKKQQAFS